MPRFPATLFGPQPLAAIAGVFAVAIIMPSMINPPGQSSGQASGTKTIWAVTVSGQKVAVPPPKFIPTPIHPEKLTHPRTDDMGAVTAAHAPWSHSARMRHAMRVRHTARMGHAASVPQLPGIDISGYQGNIDWGAVAPNIDFSYAKATEGTYYTNPFFPNQYLGPYHHGLIRGAYHFAIPSNSSGQAQALYFIRHGGGWSADGRTLPGALDIEYNPYGKECYRLTQSQMVAWIRDFINEYAFREHAFPAIYSTTDWWTTCTGNYGGFARNDPLWIANYSASGGGPLPRGWGFYTIWQYAAGGNLPGDQDLFNGAYRRLQILARRG